MTTEAKKEVVEPVPWWAWVIIAAIISGFVAWHIWNTNGGGGKFASASSYPVCADAQGRIEVSLTKVTEIPMHPTCVSGWVHLPYGFKGYLKTVGDLESEVFFLDGRRVLSPKGKPVDYGDHPNNRDFRVRGDEGILQIQPGPPRTNAQASAPLTTGSTSAKE